MQGNDDERSLDCQASSAVGTASEVGHLDAQIASDLTSSNPLAI